MTAQVATKPLIKATTFNRVTDKSGIFLGYVVKSDSTSAYYHLTFDGQYWQCDCPARCRCKHIKALNEHLKARRELKEQVVTPALAPAVETFPLVAVLQEAQAAMVLFNRQVKSGLAAADAYEVIAAMQAAVNSAPVGLKSSKSTCDVCGREAKQAGICGQCGGY